MAYKVIPFTANLSQKDGAGTSAAQLEELIELQERNGYEFVTMSSIETNIEGTSGCLGIGAKPGYTTNIAVVIFKK